MNTPSPLVPQGTTRAKNKSTIRIAFFSILIVHVVFIGGLLIQGCTKDNPPAGDKPAGTNVMESMPANGDVATTPSATDPNAVSGTVPTTETTAIAPVGTTSTALPGSITTTTGATTGVTAVPTGATHEYAIAKGDTLGAIAKKNGVTLKALQDANPGLNAVRLQIGQKIQIPAGSSAVASTASAATIADTASTDSSVYTVKTGDRLEKIARSHGTTVKAIASLNGLKSINSLKVGQKLKLPAAKSASTDATPVSAPTPTATSTPTTTALAPTGTANN